MSAAEEELLVASTALDVATHFAGGSALALPREGAFFGVDATGLAGILAQMGSSIATLRDEMVDPPSWLEDVSKKLTRLDKLDRGFGALTEIVSNLMSVAHLSETAGGAKAQSELELLRQRSTRGPEIEALAAPDPALLARFAAMKLQLESFERRQAKAPAYEDVEQLKDYVRERTKKLKATLVSLQSQMERKFDVRSKTHVEGFDKWQSDLMEVTGGRLRTLEDAIKETNSELDEFRDANGGETRELQELTRKDKDWSTREFASCNSQTLNLQIMIHKVIERVVTLEKEATTREHNASAAADEARLRFAQLAEQVAAHANRLEQDEEALRVTTDRLDAGLERSREAEELQAESRALSKQRDAELASVSAQLGKQRAELSETRLARDALTQRADEDRAVATALDAERSEAIRALEKLLLDAKEETKGLQIRVSEVKHVVRDMPDKLEFLEEAVETLREDVSTARELSGGESITDRVDNIEYAQAGLLKLQQQVLQMDAAVTTVNGDVLKLEQGQAELRSDKERDDAAVALLATKLEQVDKQVARVTTETKKAEVAVNETLKRVRRDALTLKQKQTQLERAVRDDDSGSQTVDGSGTGTGGSGDDRPSSSAGKNRRTTLAHRPQQQQLRFVKNEAHDMARECRAYERDCAAKDCLLNFSHATSLAVSEASLEMAQYLAEKSDLWAVMRLDETGSSKKSGDLSNDADVTARREHDATAWIEQARVECARTVVDRASPLQLKARERFFQRLTHALEMSLSKHDQVLVTRTSLLSKAGSVPTCVVCDRPLPAKRSNTSLTNTNAALDANIKLATSRPSNAQQRAPLDDESAFSPPQQQPRKAKSLTTRPNNPDQGKGPQFIYRGGFKMPNKPEEVMTSSASLPRLHNSASQNPNLSPTSSFVSFSNGAGPNAPNDPNSSQQWKDVRDPATEEWVGAWN